MQLAGRPMVEWSVEAFRAASSVAAIVVACPPGVEHGLGGPDLKTVDGGETRSASVSNALASVETELVAVHDAARPLVTPSLIEELVTTLTAAPQAAGVIAATPVTDTIKRTPRRALGIEETVDREGLWAAQTPQVFRTAALRGGLEGDPGRVAAATDEAMLVEAAGGQVLIWPASPENLKVTTPLDLRLAAALLAQRGGVGPSAQ